ncbi:MAG: hypothetical protein LAN84_04125 [Acidobacteriia bacterium]|nr:hypothetical protein [Terriglobia bacterium]
MPQTAQQAGNYLPGRFGLLDLKAERARGFGGLQDLVAVRPALAIAIEAIPETLGYITPSDIPAKRFLKFGDARPGLYRRASFEKLADRGLLFTHLLFKLGEQTAGVEQFTEFCLGDLLGNCLGERDDCGFRLLDGMDYTL